MTPDPLEDMRIAAEKDFELKRQIEPLEEIEAVIDGSAGLTQLFQEAALAEDRFLNEYRKCVTDEERETMERTGKSPYSTEEVSTPVSPTMMECLNFIILCKVSGYLTSQNSQSSEDNICASLQRQIATPWQP